MKAALRGKEDVNEYSLPLPLPMSLSLSLCLCAKLYFCPSSCPCPYSYPCSCFCPCPRRTPSPLEITGHKFLCIMMPLAFPMKLNMKGKRSKDRNQSQELEWMGAHICTRRRGGTGIQLFRVVSYRARKDGYSNATDRDFIDALSRWSKTNSPFETSSGATRRKVREGKRMNCGRYRDTDELGPGLMLQLEAEKIERPSLKSDDSNRRWT